MRAATSPDEPERLVGGAGNYGIVGLVWDGDPHPGERAYFAVPHRVDHRRKAPPHPKTAVIHHFGGKKVELAVIGLHNGTAPAAVPPRGSHRRVSALSEWVVDSTGKTMAKRVVSIQESER